VNILTTEATLYQLENYNYYNRVYIVTRINIVMTHKNSDITLQNLIMRHPPSVST